jgi:hypothetical protein
MHSARKALFIPFLLLAGGLILLLLTAGSGATDKPQAREIVDKVDGLLRGESRKKGDS